MPVLHPAELWQQSGRWDDIKDEMFRLKDRYGRDMCLGMTHEEVVAWLAVEGDPLLSRAAADLVPDPDEGARRGAPALGRPPDARVLDEGRLHPRSRRRRRWTSRTRSRRKRTGGSSQRCGVAFHVVRVRRRDDGRRRARTSSWPRARPARTRSRSAPACGYAANVELARSRPPAAPSVDAPRERGCDARRADHRRGVPAARDRSRAQTIKSPALHGAGRAGPRAGPRRPRAARAKLARLLGGEVRAGASRRGPRRPRRAGRARSGPVGARGADRRRRVASGRGRTWSGANREGFHLRGVAPGRDFAARFADLHVALAGEACPSCGDAARWSSASSRSATSSSSGRTYSAALGATYLDEQGQAAADRHGVVRHRPRPHRRVGDRAASRRGRHRLALVHRAVPGASWSPSAPKQPAVRERPSEIYRELREAGFDVMLDDRDERPGVKFKDADLLGMPDPGDRRQRLLAHEGKVEVRTRRDRQDVAVAPDGVVVGRPGPRHGAWRRSSRAFVSQRPEGFLDSSVSGYTEWLTEKVGAAHFFVRWSESTERGRRVATGTGLAGVETAVETVVLPAVESHGLTLVDLEWRGNGRRAVAAALRRQAGWGGRRATASRSQPGSRGPARRLGPHRGAATTWKSRPRASTASCGRIGSSAGRSGEPVRCWLREPVDGRRDARGPARPGRRGRPDARHRPESARSVPRSLVTKARLEVEPTWPAESRRL